MNDASTTRARSSPLFDWAMAFLSVLLMGGLLLDGWAHSHGEVDQSFVTPWHALLYGSMAVNGLVLLGAGIAGLLRGYRGKGIAGLLGLFGWSRFRNALPAGYWGAAIGVVIFVVGGGFDFWWHTRFGIENGIVLLVSPPHLILALAAALIFSGPLFSIGAQYGREAGGWRRIGPAVCSTWALVTLVGFFLAYAQPIEDGFTPAAIGPGSGEAVYPMAYVIDTKGALTRISMPPKTDLALIEASPDGRHLVYRVNRYQDADSSPPSDIFVSDLDGTNRVRLTGSGNHDTQPQWSPDGTSIAYVAIPAESSGKFGIHVMRANGTNDATLLSQDTTISDLSWSPDGHSIAYGSRNGTTAMIGVVDVATQQTHWLPFTAKGSSPVWTANGLYFLGGDNSIRIASIDGGNARKLARASDQTPSISRDGRQIAYVSSDLGSEQLFVSDADGSSPRDLSQLSGLNVESAAWTPDGRIVFTALGRSSQLHSGSGPTIALTAILLQGILLAGGVLLLVRRWNVPPGALTLVLAFFALSMAVQTDLYVYAIAGVVTGLLADIAVAVLRDRIRGGRFFYVLGFAVPALFTSLYLIITVQGAGGHSGWVWNLLLGAPMLAGSAGLFLAYCFDSPLRTVPAPTG